jgi:hypothetical protein
VPDVEQGLVARGLSPVVAAAVVTSVLEGWVREQREPLGEGEWGERLHRILSVVAGCTCLLLAYWFGRGLSVGRTLLWLPWPLACIWFPEMMGRSADSGAAAIIRFSGWVVLFLIGGYRVWLP